MSGFPSLSIVGVGFSSPLLIQLGHDDFINPTTSFNLGLYVKFASGSIMTVTVLVSGALDPVGANRWIPHSILTGITTDSASNIAYPCNALMLQCTQYTIGSCTLDVAKWP